jgi:hypothetical protein
VHASGRKPRGDKAERPRLTRLETSGYLDRLGYEVEDASFDRIFRNPDSISKALRESTLTTP